jgi:TolB-like protein/Tfp pilus assembly protein PilF
MYSPMTELVGQTIKNYRILRRVGGGGMGAIYEAEDQRLHRRVALKLLPESWATGSERQVRFEREAQVLAHLSHPNIVTVFSLEDAGDLSFITMELVDGQPLSDLIPLGGFSAELFLELAPQLADALQAAHERGVIHRDLKPANIMIARDGRLKVLDFGLAKSFQGEVIDARDPVTQEGQLLGTLPYMSPEQLRGEPIDYRSDIFSLGIILFEMAVGARPFAGSRFGEIAAGILHDDPPSVSTGNASVPAAVSRIVKRCLAKNPDDRYQRVSEIRDELVALQRSGTRFDLEATRTDLSALFTRRSPLRRRLLPVAAGVVALGLAGWLAWALLSPDAPAPASRLAEAGDGSVQRVRRIVIKPFENLGPAENAYFAAGVTEEVTSRLALIEQLQVVSRAAATPLDELDADFVLEGSVRWGGGADPLAARQVRINPRLLQVPEGVVVWSHSFDLVLDDLFTVQTEVATEVLRRLDLAILEPERHALGAAPTERLDAYTAFQRGQELAGRRDPKAQNWREAVAYFEQAVSLDPNFALAWARLSEVHSLAYQLRVDHKPERMHAAREAADKALALHPDLPQGHRALGYYHYWCHRDYALALESFEVAARKMPHDSSTQAGRAYVMRRLGRFDEALGFLREALAADPDSAWLNAELARTLRTLRRYEEAEVYFIRAITLGPDQPNNYVMRAENFLLWQGDAKAARRTLESAPVQRDTAIRVGLFHLDLIDRNYDVAMKRLEETPSELIGADATTFPKTFLRGWTESLRGENAAAATSFFRAARQDLERRLEDNTDDFRIYCTLALTLAALGEDEQALARARRAVEMVPVDRDAVIGPMVVRNYAVTLAWLGREAEARAELDKVLAIPADISVAQILVDPSFAAARDSGPFRELAASPPASPAAPATR